MVYVGETGALKVLSEMWSIDYPVSTECFGSWGRYFFVDHSLLVQK